MAKRSKFGRAEIEEAWRATEVDMIYRLSAAGVRVPQPLAFMDGVLVMELVRGHDGEPAPRLVDADFTEDEAWDTFHIVLQEVVKMLCAGVVHGDLSDFNVLLSWDGPVVIDFPQAVDAAHNRNAKKLLVRDVDNLTSFLARYTKRLKRTRYGDEMWALYEAGELRPDTQLTGRFKGSTKKADTHSLLEEIEAIAAESRRKREELGLKPRRKARTPVTARPEKEPRSRSRKKPDATKEPRTRTRSRKKPGASEARSAATKSSRPAQDRSTSGEGGERRRRRRKKPSSSRPSVAKRSLPDFDLSDDLDAFLS